MMNTTCRRLLNICQRGNIGLSTIAGSLSSFKIERNPPTHLLLRAVCIRWQSTVGPFTTTTPTTAITTIGEQKRQQEDEIDADSKGPVGELFQSPDFVRDYDDTMVGKTGSIRRVFGPQSNAQAMITCGGEELAAKASFDPNYGRAKDWIRAHPVGPAVLSGPVLISGLVGALVEAAFPKSVAIQSNLQFHRPLIVGVEVRAKIVVLNVFRTGCSDDTCATTAATTSIDDLAAAVGDSEEVASLSSQDNLEFRKRKNGFQVDLRTTVVRINDDLIIAQGNHSVWVPDYLHTSM